MKRSHKFLFSATFISMLFLVNCQGKDCSECCNETDAMYGEDRGTEAAANPQENASGNANMERNESRKGSGQSKGNVIENPGKAPVNKLDEAETPEGAGLNSSGQNIGNKNSSQTNPAGGSASSAGTRGNSGQGRPY